MFRVTTMDRNSRLEYPHLVVTSALELTIDQSIGSPFRDLFSNGVRVSTH
jgi:hypothetical protein